MSAPDNPNDGSTDYKSPGGPVTRVDDARSLILDRVQEHPDEYRYLRDYICSGCSDRCIQPGESLLSRFNLCLDCCAHLMVDGSARERDFA
jgi:hypothetical protein